MGSSQSIGNRLRRLGRRLAKNQAVGQRLFDPLLKIVEVFEHGGVACFKIEEERKLGGRVG